MGAFKCKDGGTWFAQFRYVDWKGEKQQKTKRGFATKREALEWERQFLMKQRADIRMTFESFTQLYEQDVKPKLKLNTARRFCPTSGSGCCRRLPPKTLSSGRMRYGK